MEGNLITQMMLPLFIFLARVTDVSLGTIRIMFVSRGIRMVAAILGFFEVFIWLIAITQIMHNLTNITNYFAYAAGFGLGNYVGISIERMFSFGNLLIRVVTNKDADKLVEYLSEKKYGITSVNAQGVRGPVKIILTVVKRKNVESVISIIKRFNPKAFYTIEDIRYVTESDMFSISVPQRKYLRTFYNLFEKKK
ncbi:MAG: DUF2179 domain-containing protein [bacterium]